MRFVASPLLTSGKIAASTFGNRPNTLCVIGGLAQLELLRMFVLHCRSYVNHKPAAQRCARCQERERGILCNLSSKLQCGLAQRVGASQSVNQAPRKCLLRLVTRSGQEDLSRA